MKAKGWPEIFGTACTTAQWSKVFDTAFEFFISF